MWELVMVNLLILDKLVQGILMNGSFTFMLPQQPKHITDFLCFVSLV